MIDRYVIRLVAIPSLAGFGLLLLLVTAFNAGELLRDPAISQFPARYLIEMLLMRDIIASEVLLPTAIYVGLLVTMIHWHRDREAWAFYAAGATPGRLTRPVVIISCALALIIALLALVVRPWAYAQTYALDNEALHLSTDVMQPHQFYSWSDELVISAADIDHDSGEMRGVFAQETGDDGVRIIRAARGRILAPDSGRRQRIELSEGTSYWVEHLRRGDRGTRFNRLTYVSPPLEENDPQSKRRARPTLELFGSTHPKEIAELQWRLSMPWLALFITLMGGELVRALPGSNVFTRYLLGLGMFAVVFNVAAIGRTWVENGRVDPMPGMYWVPALAAAVYLTLRGLPRLRLSRPK
jgi:lipopolysaccharide export system permease protein